MASLWDRPFAPPVSGAASVANQPAMNTSAANPGPLPALQAVTTTAETLIANALNPAVSMQIFLPPDRQYEQTLFNVIASGYIKTTANGTVTLKVYEGAAIAAGNLLGSSGAITQNSAAAAFFWKADLMYDSVTGTLVGTIQFYLNKTLVATVTLSNFVTGINNVNNPVLNFCYTITSTGAAAGTPTSINTQKFSCG